MHLFLSVINQENENNNMSGMGKDSDQQNLLSGSIQLFGLFREADHKSSALLVS